MNDWGREVAKAQRRFEELTGKSAEYDRFDETTLRAECKWLIVQYVHLAERNAELMRHAPRVEGETNVEHSRRCARCQYDARVGPVRLRYAQAGVPPAG